MLPPNNRKGSGFTNINRVVTANQGNQLGGTVASGVQNQANQVKTQAQQATTNFNEEAQKKRLDTDEAANARDTVIGRVVGDQPQPVNSNTANTNAQGAAPQSGVVQGPSDQELTDFTRYRTGTYEGPNQLKDYQTLAGKAANTEMLGDLSRSTGGRQELLKRFVGGAGYTQGQQGLDNLLLGQSGNALNQTRRATQGLSQDVAGANTQASNLAQEYANRAKIFGEETVNKLGAARDPISAKIDEQLKANQGLEDTRKGNLKYLQDALMGTSDQYKGLDRITRLGLGLQSAKDAGYLTDAQANQLLGEGGLIQRSEQLGLDTNSLLNERLKDIAAQNLNRGGAASGYQESQLNALDRLLGKQGTDLEFNQEGADFQKGNVGFDTDSLNDYLSTTERAKYQNDAAKQADLEAYNQRYINQAMGGAQQAVGGGMQAVGGALGQMLDPASVLKPGQTLENAGNIAGGIGNMGVGQAQAATQGTNALLEGLTKLNIGGQSIANTEGGRQLLKAIELKAKLEKEGLGAANQGISSLTGGLNNLAAGNIGSALGDLSGYNLAKNLSSDVANNVSKSVSNAVSNITGGGIKISDEDLKTNIDYDSKHIDEFLNKLKPASYEYKDEVKNSPLASKGMELGVMAQDLEKSKAGKEAVIDTDAGKVVDYDSLQPKMLAALASLNEKVNKLEKDKKK